MTGLASTEELVADERSQGSRLENMSSRPTTVVTHRASRKRCQLVPSLRVELEPHRDKIARKEGRALMAAGLPHSVQLAEPVEQARMVERVCRAVVEDLRLPGVIPLAPDGKVPHEEARSDALLALVVLTRCSGPVWLRDRAAALERLAAGRPVRLLLQPELFRHVVERLDTPGWEAEILSRVEGSEAWS